MSSNLDCNLTLLGPVKADEAVIVTVGGHVPVAQARDIADRVKAATGSTRVMIVPNAMKMAVISKEAADLIEAAFNLSK